jgi:hypothetical protein
MLATIFLASTLGWIGFARAAAMDMLFTVTLDLALLLLALWLWDRKPLRLYGFYIFLGLATLAKGPLAIVLAGLVCLGYVATFRDWTALKATLLSPAVAAFFIVAGPWYALCYAANGAAFINEFIVQHNLARFVSADALGHGQPAWFYIPVLAAGLFPWSPMLLLPLGELVHGARNILRDRQKALLFWWIVLPFVFFSLSENKLPGYILPILPPLTLWIAMLVEQASRSGASAGEGDAAAAKDSSCGLPESVPLVLIGMSALLLLTVPLFAPLLSESLATGLRQALADWSLGGAWRGIQSGAVPFSRWLLLAGAVGFTIYFAIRKQPLFASYMLLAGIAVCMLAITTHLAPLINRIASTRTIAERVTEMSVRPGEVAVYRLHRNQTYQLSYYLGRGLPEWSPQDTASDTSIVIAAQDQQIPIARPMSFFPGQRIRIWELIGLRIETEPRP